MRARCRELLRHSRRLGDARLVEILRFRAHFVVYVRNYPVLQGAPVASWPRSPLPARTAKRPSSRPECVATSGGWDTTWKLLVAIGIGLVVLAAGPLRKGSFSREELDLRTFAWLAPYLGGLAFLTFYGQFKGGREQLPFGIDLAVVAVFALVTYFVAVRESAPSHLVQRYLAEDTDTGGEREAVPA